MKSFRQRAGWLILSALCLASLPLSAQRSDPYGLKPANHAANRAAAAVLHEAALKAHAGDPQVLVLPGVVADRRSNRIELAVERSAVERNSPCEFLVVAENSDHTYETLLIAFAKPGDVHRALEFLGLRPGAGSDPERLRHWARGEPLKLRLERTNNPPVAIESLLQDRRTGQAWPPSRFLFTGSRRFPGHDGAEIYAADTAQPRAIAALFNTPYSVLEVPQRARKDVIYQNTVISAEGTRPGDDGLLTLVLEPLSPPGQSQLRDLNLEAHLAPEASAAASEADRLKSLRLQLKEFNQMQLDGAPVTRLLEHLATLDRQAHEYFLTIRFGADLTLRHARDLAGVLALVDSDRGVRVEPPPVGQFHYRAFAPDRDLLDRETRVLQPLELVLKETDGRLTGTFFTTQKRTPTGTSRAELTWAAVPVAEPAALRRAMDSALQQLRDAGQPPTPTLLVFAPSTLRYGVLMDWLTPAATTHPVIHVFLDEPEGSLPKATAGK